MAKCELCGNDYDKTFEITKEGKTHTFDSFECAIQVVARRNAITAAAKSSATASKPAARVFAVPIARDKAEKRTCAIADNGPTRPDGAAAKIFVPKPFASSALCATIAEALRDRA